MDRQAFKKKTSGTASLQGRSAARTVLLEMARDTARAERITSVIDQRKADDPTFTSRYISDELGVSERAVGHWKKTGSLARENSDRLAKLAHVDPVWLWLGRKHADAPDLLDTLNGAGPSHQVELVQEEFRDRVDRLESKLNKVLGNQALILKALDISQPVEDAEPIVPLRGALAPGAPTDPPSRQTHRPTGSEGS